MAFTKEFFPQQLATFHENGPWPLKRLLETITDDSHDISDPYVTYVNNSNEIRRVLKDCLSRNEGFRAFGSLWSLSNLPHHEDNMHHHHSMNIKIKINSADLHQNSTYDHNNLKFVECGNRIKEISTWLHKTNKSLKTSGASNGQTIAGAISTGVHGSALDFGSVQDFVVGLNLITGPNENDVIYLERASRTALNDQFAAKIKARIIRDDDMFNCALVSLGAFGFIHGVVIEVQDVFLLKRYFGIIEQCDAIKLGKTLNFDDAPTVIHTFQNEIADEVEGGTGIRPYHYKIYVNPYKPKKAFTTEIIYKKPFISGASSPFSALANTVSPDLLSFVSKIMYGKPCTVRAFLKIAHKSFLPKTDERAITGRLADIFFDSFHQGAAFAFSVGFDHKYVEDGLSIFREVLAGKKGIRLPAAIGIRFVKASEATLAFTKFPVTCAMEVNGVLPRHKPGKNNSARTKALQRVDTFSKRVIEEFDKKGIPFTLHWGKGAPWEKAGLVDNMYGPRADLWRMNRKKLLGPAGTEELFANKFTRDIGLC